MLQLPRRPSHKCSSYNSTLHANSHNLVRCWNRKLYFSFCCSWCCIGVLHKWSLFGNNCYNQAETCIQQTNIFRQYHRHTNYRKTLLKQYITTVFFPYLKFDLKYYSQFEEFSSVFLRNNYAVIISDSRKLNYSSSVQFVSSLFSLFFFYL